MKWIPFLTLAIAFLLTCKVCGQATLQLSSMNYTVAENADNAILKVQRAGDINTEAGVNYATIDGTAINGLKYTAVSGTLTFGVGETNKAIAVPILNNGLVDGSKNFRVLLSNPSGGAVLGTRTNVLVL